MQLLRSCAVYLIALTGLFLPIHGQAQETQEQDDGVILDLDALKSLEKEKAERSADETIYVVNYEPAATEPSNNDDPAIRKATDAARDERVRLTIVAFASMAEGQSENDARRLALRRAIALRQILVAAGVDGSRVNLQPKGLNPEGGEKNDQAQIIVQRP